MDLRLYFRVLWRFRIIIAAGFLLACALSFFSFAKVSFAGGSPRVSYRQAETWQATNLMFITEKGFPYGYTVLPTEPTTVRGSSATSTSVVPSLGDVGRLTQLSVYYAPFAQSDAFQAMLRRRTHIKGIVQASAVLDPVHKFPEPYIDVFGFAAKPTDAVQLANEGSAVLSKYIVGQQNANNIPANKRVQVLVLSRARKAVVSAKRKITTPIVVFLTVLLAVVGLAFVLENLRPRIHPVLSVTEDKDDQQALTVRKPA